MFSPQLNQIVGRCARFLGVVAVAATLAGQAACTGGRTQKGNDAREDAPVSETQPGIAEDASPAEIVEHYMNEQTREFATVAGARSGRIGDTINVTWSSTTLFDLDSAMLRLEAQKSLTRMATILTDYPDTDLLITGHADSTGADAYNLKLSERRAQSVVTFLTKNGISPARVTTHIAADRLLIDRVEIEIRPNAALKQRASQAE